MKPLNLFIFAIIMTGIVFLTGSQPSFGQWSYCCLENSMPYKSGNAISINTTKQNYLGGETLKIEGLSYPSAFVQLFLKDPKNLTSDAGSIYADSSNGYFVSELTLPNNAVNGIWSVVANDSYTQSVLNVLVGNVSTHNVSGLGIPLPLSKMVPPLRMINEGYLATDVKCNMGLSLVTKAETRLPACVKPSTATILVGRGWALDQVLQTSEDVAINSSSSLQLSLSTNSSIVQSGQAIGITLSLDNVSPHLLTMNPQNNWPIKGLDSGGCSNSPMGVAILDGFYTVQNMSDGHPMVFHFLYPCPPSLSTKSFTFYPLSNNVTIICEPGDWAPCQNLMQTKASVAYNKFLQDGKFFDFNSGNYTIIVGDEWGDVAIRHFQVVNSTQIHMEYDQPIVTQTYELHGEIKDIMPSTIFGKLTSSSTGIAISRGGGLDTYDNDSIKLELNYGNASGSHVISATVQNLGKKTVHIYDIFISGFIPLANDDHLNFVVVRGDPYVVSKDNAILEPGESVTKYIVGNWTVDEKPVNGFSAGASYSYDDLQNFDGMTNGYSMSVPVQWVK